MHKDECSFVFCCIKCQKMPQYDNKQVFSEILKKQNIGKLRADIAIV